MLNEFYDNYINRILTTVWMYDWNCTVNLNIWKKKHNNVW